MSTVNESKLKKLLFNIPKNTVITSKYLSGIGISYDLQKRYELENERYWELYRVRKEDESNYDLVIDTTNLTTEQTADIIEKAYKKWLEE